MGNFSASKPYNPDLWEQLSPSLLRNYDTGEEIEIHVLDLDNKQQQADYIYDYELRRNPHPPFVRVLNYRFDQGHTCGPYQAYAYTEHIHRLCDLELSVPQAVYVLVEAIIAFSLLFQEYGPFYINSKMLGVNQLGRVKVWLSDNFAENQVSDPVGFKEYLTEQDVVFDLAHLVEEQLDQDYLSRLLEPYDGRLNFENALKVLFVVQNKELVKVDKVYLDKEEYNRFLAKQFLSAGNNSTSKTNNSNKVTTTTTTTTTTQIIQPQPVAVVQPQAQILLPSQQSRLAVPQQYFYEYNTSSSTLGVHPTITTIQLPKPSIPTIIPYQKATHQNRRRPQQPTVRIINKPETSDGGGGNPYLKPIARVQARPRLERVMPTTQKNEVEKRLEQQLRENYKQIPQVESRIVVANNTQQNGARPPSKVFDRRSMELTESVILQNLKALH